MTKNKGFDIIADAQERAQHPYDTPYWFNRVTSFTMARWKANKYFAPLSFATLTLVEVIWIRSIYLTALAAGQSFWSVLFDAHDSMAAGRLSGILSYSIFWVIYGIATVQVLLQRGRPAAPVPQPEHKREKKKKYPKRPKNYR